MTIERASDNPFPSILLQEHVDPATPPSGHWRIFIDTDNILKKIDDAGTVTSLESDVGFADPMTTRGDIILRNASNVTARLGRGSAGQVLTSDGTDLSWQTPSSGFADPMTSRGDIIVRNSSNATARLPIGSSGKVLSSDGTDISWQTPTGGGVGNMWKMSKNSTSQTLTNATDTLVTWEEGATIDGGGSVIDLANDKFVAPATGFYLLNVVWLWESTAPDGAAAITCKVGSTEVGPRNRVQPATLTGNGGANAIFALTLSTSDAVTVLINPGAVTGVTARGNASQHIRTSAWLVRIT